MAGLAASLLLASIHGIVLASVLHRRERHRRVLGGDIDLGAAEMDPHDVRVRVGALAPLLAHGRWNVIGGIRATMHTPRSIE